MTPQDAREEEQSQRIRIDWGEWTIARTAAAAAAAAFREGGRERQNGGYKAGMISVPRSDD